MSSRTRPDQRYGVQGDVFAQDDIPVHQRMLVAMLQDQIQTLGTLRNLGMWREDPREIADWLRAREGNVRGGYISDTAMHELRLWGRATDVLVEVLERETMFRVDRARIVALAKAAAERTWGRGWIARQVA